MAFNFAGPEELEEWGKLVGLSRGNRDDDEYRRCLLMLIGDRDWTVRIPLRYGYYLIKPQTCESKQSIMAKLVKMEESHGLDDDPTDRVGLAWMLPDGTERSWHFFITNGWHYNGRRIGK